jgi:hypothetical protein
VVIDFHRAAAPGIDGRSIGIVVAMIGETR